MKISTYRIEMRGRGRIPVRVREETFDIGEYGWDGPKEMARIACMAFRLHKMAEEYVVAIAMDARGKPKAAFEISHGSDGCAPASACGILRRVLLAGSDMYVLLHNHPSGNTEPSANDREACAGLEKASSAIGVKLVDFIIVGKGGRYCSFLESGLM